MKCENKREIKRWLRWGTALMFCLGLVLPLSFRTASGATTGDIAGSISGKGQFYLVKWTPMVDASKNGNFPAGDHYILMLNECNRIIDENTQMVAGPDEAMLTTGDNWTPFTYGLRSSADYFYSLGLHGVPITRRQGWDGDNNGYEHSFWLTQSEYPYAPLRTVDRDGAGDWDEFARYSKNVITPTADYLQKYIGSDPLPDLGKSGSFFTIANAHKKPGDYPGKFCIYKNIKHEDDPAWQVYKGAGDSYGGQNIYGNVFCDCEDDWGDKCWFNIWLAYPRDITVFSSLSKSYTVKNGQTLTLNGEAGYRGIYIMPQVTLKVEKGGCLAINEMVFNDGTILCDGGTVIIQSEGRLAPLGTDTATGGSSYSTNGKNKIIVQNGGDLIIMKGGCLYTTENYPLTLIESRMVNFGDYIMGGNLYLYSAFVENRSTGRIISGYNFSRPDLRANFQEITVYDTYVSGMENTKAASHSGLIYVYDTTDHYSQYGCLNQDGILSNFVYTNDTQTDIRFYGCKDGEELKEAVSKALESENSPIGNVSYGSV